MADKSLRLDFNAPGSFYVTEECVDCDLCRNVAPRMFQRDDVSSFSYVIRQPENDEERKEAEEALQACPTEAIGSDG